MAMKSVANSASYDYLMDHIRFSQLVWKFSKRPFNDYMLRCYNVSQWQIEEDDPVSCSDMFLGRET